MHNKTKEIINIFEKISAIPRKSKQEEKIIAFLLNWAKENSLESSVDEAGNVLIKVPPSKGFENRPGIVLQGHMDMVCEKTPESKHDFSNDPIKFIYDGDWLKADQTSLGADNGIALALAMAIASDKDVLHPPLELLFTIDEETGLTGANKLQPDLLKGKYLLNIDSEDEGVLTIGCAGGMATNIQIPLFFIKEQIPHLTQYELEVGKLSGGHSGIDIKKEGGNAIKILARTLSIISEKYEFNLSQIKGGSAHNAIARSSKATLFFDEKNFSNIEKLIKDFEVLLKNEFGEKDSNLTLELIKSSEKNNRFILTNESKNLVINTLLALPHGVFSRSDKIEGLIETSNNLATVEIKNEQLSILTSQRSSTPSKLTALTKQIESIVNIASGSFINNDGYPAWNPDWNSSLLCKCKETYKKLFGKDPVIEVIHAGLECGIIGSKYAGMEMISLGPTISNPHSPDEKLKISDIEKIWVFLVELLKELK